VENNALFASTASNNAILQITQTKACKEENIGRFPRSK